MAGGIFAWLDNLPLPLLGLVFLLSLLVAGGGGFALHRWKTKGSDTTDTTLGHIQESSIISGLLGLLTLLLAFTFSLTIDRFETRRQLVIANSNAISTAYLRVQLLPEPHRTRLSGLLLDHTRNLLLLARARRDQVPTLLAQDDRLIADIWSATGAAYDVTRTTPFSGNFLDTMNALIDANATRRGERLARIPDRVLAALFLYIAITAAIFGYFLSGTRTRIAASLLMGLLVISLLLIVDIDQPTRDRIVESQSSVESVLQMIKKQPPGSYDRWRTPQ